MPAAAVTPAPIAYIKVAAVKKLVVGSGLRCDCQFVWVVLHGRPADWYIRALLRSCVWMAARLSGWCWVSGATP